MRMVRYEKGQRVTLENGLLRTSFHLVVMRERNLTERFYAVLFEHYPQLEPLFADARQSRRDMLMQALGAFVQHFEDPDWLEEELGVLGARHVRYGVTPEMYPWVGDALLRTLRDIGGEEWTQAYDNAWAEAYELFASLMIAAAHHQSPTSP